MDNTNADLSVLRATLLAQIQQESLVIAGRLLRSSHEQMITLLADDLPEKFIYLMNLLHLHVPNENTKTDILSAISEFSGLYSSLQMLQYKESVKTVRLDNMHNRARGKTETEKAMAIRLAKEVRRDQNGRIVDIKGLLMRVNHERELLNEEAKRQYTVQSKQTKGGRLKPFKPINPIVDRTLKRWLGITT